MFTDADIEMAELAEQGDMIANGVCPICEEALDPLAYAAKHPRAYTNPRYTAEMAAACVGPVDEQMHCHVLCLEEAS
jgi:hypothetical protein